MKCKYPDSVCVNITILGGVAYCGSVPCSLRGEIPPPTNADSIRAMSDEELAKLIDEHCKCYTCPCYGKCTTKGCRDSLLDWLKQED